MVVEEAAGLVPRPQVVKEGLKGVEEVVEERDSLVVLLGEVEVAVRQVRRRRLVEDLEVEGLEGWRALMLGVLAVVEALRLREVEAEELVESVMVCQNLAGQEVVAVVRLLGIPLVMLWAFLKQAAVPEVSCLLAEGVSACLPQCRL